jgi:hypothetical protein
LGVCFKIKASERKAGKRLDLDGQMENLASYLLPSEHTLLKIIVLERANFDSFIMRFLILLLSYPSF